MKKELEEKLLNVSIDELTFFADVAMLKSSKLINILNARLDRKFVPSYKTFIFPDYREDNIYVLKSYGETENLIKVGYSDQIEKRLKQYKEHNPNIEIIDTFHIHNAKEFESDFHKSRKSVFKREWYKEDELDDILNILRLEAFKSKDILVSQL